MIKHAHTKTDREVYRSDKARSTHFRCNEAAGAFEDARVLAPSYRCWSSSVPAAFSQGRVPLDPRGPTGPQRSSLVSSSQACSSPSHIDRRQPIEPRAFTSHWLSTRTNLVVRTGRSMSTVKARTCASKLTSIVESLGVLGLGLFDEVSSLSPHKDDRIKLELGGTKREKRRRRSKIRDRGETKWKLRRKMVRLSLKWPTLSDPTQH